MMSVSPPGYSSSVDRGGEPSSTGCKPAVFPLDDTSSHPVSGPGGGRTHIPLFKRQVLRRLSYKAVRAVCRAGVEPAQRLRVGYSHLGSPVLGRHVRRNTLDGI